MLTKDSNTYFGAICFSGNHSPETSWGYMTYTFVYNTTAAELFKVFDWLQIGNQTGHFVLVHILLELLPLLDSFLVSLLGSKRLLLHVFVHCVIHKKYLLTKNFNILQDVIKIINGIKVHTLNWHIHTTLREAGFRAHTSFLTHRSVRGSFFLFFNAHFWS